MTKIVREAGCLDHVRIQAAEGRDRRLVSLFPKQILG